MKKNKKIASKREQYQLKLKELQEVFLAVTVGDYSVDLDIPNDEDKFTEFHFGVKLMLDTIKEKMSELEELRKKLDSIDQDVSGKLKEFELISQVGTWEWNTGQPSIRCSEQLTRLFEIYPHVKSQLEIRTLYRHIHPNEIRPFKEAWLNALAFKSSWHQVFRIRTLTGKFKVLLGKGEPEIDNYGNIQRFYGTVQDITDIVAERKEGSNPGNLLNPAQDNNNTIQDPPLPLHGLNYKTLINSLHDGVILVNNQHKVEYANDAALELLGYTKNEMVGSPLYLFLSPSKTGDKTSKNLPPLIESTNSRFEFEIKKKNGELFWVQIRKIPIAENAGAVIGHTYIIRNIDSRKKYEVKVSSVANFAIENPNPTMRFSIEEQKFIFFNKASKHLVRYLYSKSNEPLLNELKEKINRYYEKQQIAREEFKINKQTFLFTFVTVKEKKYVNLYGNDLTAIKKAESEIKRLLFVLSQTDNCVIIADKNGKIQWVNEGFEKMSGFKLADVKGTTGSILRKGKPTGLDPNNHYFKKMFLTKQSVSYESRNYKKDGTFYWVITTITPVLDQDGKIDGIVAVDADISLKKKVEQQMFLAMQMSEESAKAKQSFLANMSHEIRTPMNVIMGIIQLLRDTPLNEEQKDYLNSMDFAGENLLSIVNDVLDLSKIDSGKMSIEKLEFNLKYLIKELINSIGYRASEKSLKIEVEIAPEVPSQLIGDPLRLNQILINLLSNSIKFTNEGEIKLTVNATTEGRTTELKFAVKDTGIGIPPEKQKVIFEEFEQAHFGNKRKYGGTGLGLSIVKKLVELQKGKIQLNSVPGIGTEFIVTLRYDISDKKEEESVEIDHTRKEVQLIQGKKMLLVEDNKLNQMVAEKFLASMGISVKIADNGIEALKKLESEYFDAILMDIQMPEMDGYETTHHIRNFLGTEKRNIPILAMTAHAFRGEEQKCIDAGMNDYIAKPLKKETLERILIKLFKQDGVEFAKTKIDT